MEKSYSPTIGLEIHAELKTNSKMFCGCKNAPHDSEPNTNVCPVCLAHPGTLPVANEVAIESVLLFGHAVGGTIATYSEFDRKNYFYPDIPKAYQISQYAFPFVSGGSVNGVTLTRVHLEEDTARSQHDKGAGSLVDFNRAGVPLMELVTEPEIHSAEAASAFAKELQLMLRTLNISDANMERGEMRVEANISVSADADMGTKVEVKNLNSFRSVEQAIEYEIARQIQLLEAGDQVIQETRGWDEQKGKTFTQRSKETAKDYRYFPDPDLPKIDVTNHEPFSSSRLKEKMPRLPEETRLFLKNLGLTSQHIETLIMCQPLLQYYAAVLDVLEENSDAYVSAANFLITDLGPQLQSASDAVQLPPEQYAALIKEFVAQTVNSRVVKDLLIEFANVADVDFQTVIAERNLAQDNSAEALLPLVQEVIAENASVVDEYKNGKESSIQFLIGQGMKKSKGAANPALLKDLLLSEISAK